jgi:hypothetical protein
MSALRARRRRLVLWAAGGLTTVVGVGAVALSVTTSGPAAGRAYTASYKKVTARHRHRTRHKPPTATATATAAAAAASSAGASSSGGFAPYVDVGLFPPFDLVDAS